MLDPSETCMGRIKNIHAIITSKLMGLLVEKNAQIYCFGSSMVNGVVEKKSDVDVVYLTREDLQKPLSIGDVCNPQSRSEQTSILSAISKILMKDSELFSTVQEKPRARVPYVRGVLKNGLEIDISAHRRNGVRNSLLLRSYFSQIPPTRPSLPNATTSVYRMLSLALKFWGKRTGLVDPVQTFLTSYAFNVLICYYLQQRGGMDFIHPESILIPKGHPTVPDYREIALAGTQGHTCLGWYMRDFLKFYNHEFDYNNTVVSLSRKGITTKEYLGWGLRDEERMHGTDGNAFFYRFCVEDPYENRLNLGRFVTPLRYSMFRMALHQAQLNGFGYLNLKNYGAKIVD
ncbi:hypothetical protein XU18_1694 [Perkinsela sp. CCAP 1560/4]|nr:hypothetical protein XU18_1694 [Perkinsela sp. CCAP 1560/4]|eukprot:KNH07600.1 hypothetical protein XU18_1694 [Perkinsela sp. CCAP 1560/4]